MKPRLVSAVAVLICGAILATVGLFGYSRYKAAQAENEAFRAQLQAPGQPAIGARMPGQLPPRATSAGGNGGASPEPGGQ